MPKRDITEIMQKDDKSVDRMQSLMGSEQRVKATPAKQKKVERSVKRTLIGRDAYTVLGVDEKSIDAILAAVRELDPKFEASRGPRSELIGGLREMHHWKIGVVEHRALRLARDADYMRKWPEGCPDPRLLARAILQQWYAQWGHELEEAVGLNEAKNA